VVMDFLRLMNIISIVNRMPQPLYHGSIVELINRTVNVTSKFDHYRPHSGIMYLIISYNNVAVDKFLIALFFIGLHRLVS